MKTRTQPCFACRFAGLLLLLPILASRAYAVAGVLDSVIITEDLTDWYKWPREERKWDELIRIVELEVENTEKLIDQHRQQLERMGVPETVTASFVGSVPDIMRPLEDAVTLETAKHAVDSGRNLFANGSNAVKVYNPANEVGATYDAMGETGTREKERYAHFAMQEALYARYRTAAKNEEEVQKAETEFQRGALERLRQARTEAEVMVLTTALTASKQRQDMAHQRASQARGELEAFRGQLTIESARKVEADREWAEHVTARMRERALAAYRRQHGETDRLRD